MACDRQGGGTLRSQWLGVAGWLGGVQPNQSVLRDAVMLPPLAEDDALAVAAIFKRTLLKGPVRPMILELPPYRFPSLKSLGVSVVQRCQLFLQRAGTVILALSIVLWAMATYPKAPVNSALPVVFWIAPRNSSKCPQLASQACAWLATSVSSVGCAAGRLSVGDVTVTQYASASGGIWGLRMRGAGVRKALNACGQVH